jgi:uracil-DNA glycosylase
MMTMRSAPAAASASSYRDGDLVVPVIVTYHPAYLLRNLPDKAKAWEDLCFARRTMREQQAAGMGLPLQAG